MVMFRADEGTAAAGALHYGVMVAPSQAHGGDGLFAVKGFRPGDSVFAEPATGTVEIRTVDGVVQPSTLHDLHGSIVASGCCCEYLERDSLGILSGPLFCGTHSSSRVQEYHAWAEEALAAKEPSERSHAAKTMLLYSFNAYTTRANERRCQSIYPVISKANHSCMPNGSVYAYDGRKGEIICIRQIEPGDEIRVSYLTDWQLALPIMQRQELVAQHWEFECLCERCVAIVDDTRRFSCSSLGCVGTCVALREDCSAAARTELKAFPAAVRCDVCGKLPSTVEVAEWLGLEDSIEWLLRGLPESLYSAWAKCEDFAEAHPDHWLTGRWKRHLALHTEREAREAEEPEEAQELRSEAEKQRAHAQRCVDAALGFSLEPPCATPTSQTNEEQILVGTERETGFRRAAIGARHVPRVDFQRGQGLFSGSGAGF